MDHSTATGTCASPAESTAAGTGRRTLLAGNFRWVICALLLFGVTKNYMDRQVLGVLKSTLQHELGWSEIDYGNIAAAFSFAYAFGYLLGGRLLDRFGVKRGLPVFVIVWSTAAMAHGLCGLL